MSRKPARTSGRQSADSCTFSNRYRHLLSAYWVAAWKCLSGSGSWDAIRRVAAGPVLIVFSPVSSVLDGSLLVKRQPPDVAPPRVQASDEGNIRGADRITAAR